MNALTPPPTKSTPRRGCRYWLRLAAFALILLIPSLYVSLALVAANGYTHPQRMPVCCETPADIGFDFETVSFPASDGVEIRGWYIPSQNGAAVILVHGIAGNRVGLLNIAAMLADHGYGVLLIDMRRHGESGGDVWWSNSAARDVLGAVDYLRARPDVDPGRIGGWGHSAGGSTLIHAAALTPEIRAVAADGPGWSSFADEPLPPYSPSELAYLPFDWVFFNAIPLFHVKDTPARAVVHDLPAIAPRPVLLIASTDVTNIERRIADHFYVAAGDPKELWLVDAPHGAKWNRFPAEYESRLAGFFDAAFR